MTSLSKLKRKRLEAKFEGNRICIGKIFTLEVEIFCFDEAQQGIFFIMQSNNYN
jgi:hypothetical protein